MFRAYCSLLLFIVLSYKLVSGRNFSWNHSLGSIGLPGVVEKSSLPPDQWFLQRLDHFDPTNPGTWWQKYQTNETWFEKLIRIVRFSSMISGEGPMAGEWMVMGSWLESAQKFKSLCFQLEHRYYGESSPVEDVSVKGLRYLSSEQALADIAYFIESMNERYKLTPKNKWVVFGGSYAGSLAAWARLKYPHLIHAAVSTSGPLLAEGDFKEYNNVVRKSLSASSQSCANNIHQAALKLEQILQKLDEAEVKMISEKFKVCGTLDVRNQKDIVFFVFQVAASIQGIVQDNKDWNPGNVASYTVDDLCKIMNNETIGSVLDRYAAVHSLTSGGAGSQCVINTHYDDFVRIMRSMTGSANFFRSWVYQTCTEFGFYQTSSNRNSLFGSLLKLQFYIDQCKDIYGEDFERNRLIEGTKRTNLLYGNKKIKVSRVVFVHGSLDPWHVLGKYESNEPETPVILIDGTAHCADMYPASPDDPPQLVSARKRIDELIGKWLSAE
uniref:Serine protease n=1 Tax=Lygus lineolaris TaxID=50650 RepID=A0A184WFY2_LYGLI|nr:serine protease [Lygus lineolaris]